MAFVKRQGAGRAGRSSRAQRRASTIERRKAGFTINMKALGVPEAQASINKLKLGVGRNVVNKALRQAAKRVLKPAVDAQIAKVSPGEFGSGKLKSNPTRIRRIGKIGVQVQTPDREKLDIEPDDPYYPALLEYGYPEGGIEPRRMLRRAHDQTYRKVRIFLRRTIGKFINAEVRKLAARGRSAFRNP